MRPGFVKERNQEKYKIKIVIKACTDIREKRW
jgi:hypothetical protein